MQHATGARRAAHRTGQQRSWLMMSSVGIILCAVFMYLPMWGLLIAFKDYSLWKGFLASPWVGFKYFRQFFSDIYFFRLLRNTFVLGVENLLLNFPAPILLALLLQELRWPAFKRLTQTISYLPHFVSTVVIVGMLKTFFASDGFVNQLLGTNVPYFTRPAFFRPMYLGSSLWQGVGWGSIIYLAAISGIDPTLYEAALIDGASRFQRVRYVTLPCIADTIVILLILNTGSVMAVGFEKVYLMYNDAVLEVADIISTYVYRMGIAKGKYGFGTAVGLFNSLINLSLLLTANLIARRLGRSSLW